MEKIIMTKGLKMLPPFPNVRVTESSGGRFGAEKYLKTHYWAFSTRIVSTTIRLQKEIEK